MTEQKLNAIEAFIIAKSEMKKPTFNKVNPHFKNKYADLAEIKKATSPALSSNKFLYNESLGFHLDQWGLLAKIVYFDGTEVISGFYPIDANMKDQQKGSAITYGRRYLRSSLCDVVADDDDDGNAAQEHEPEKKWRGPLVKTKLDAGLREYLHQVNGAGTVSEIDLIFEDYKEIIKQAKADAPLSIYGDGKDHKGIEAEVKSRKASLKLTEDQLKQPE